MDIDNKAQEFLNSVEGEISFFRSVMRARPVGIHRHFHILAIRNAIHRDTGIWVSSEDIWNKLRDYYELEVLENLEIDGYETPTSKSPSPSQQPPRSPSPSQNLSLHPYFREEYSLPADHAIDALVAARRVRSTASLPSSSPAPSPPLMKTTTRAGAKKAGKRGGKPGAGTGSRKMAGLVGGESDSSALTQDSGDEGGAGSRGGGGEGSTRMGSVATGTGTDAGTEEPEGGEEEDEQGAQETTRGRRRGGRRGGGAPSTRGRRSSVSTKPPAKKRKR
ncbi:hypothetical protein EIP91_001201 [Steccherinum ochraceum]|uniref:Chromatin modification-related protein EAF7 n=1 Tax=Steccherinum ochraceum TaxID=92696 RepID=A0A4R0RTV8_9APHY|nr:hypothetical protein EIP91_001201 [Steccherinum ochraceum]